MYSTRAVLCTQLQSWLGAFGVLSVLSLTSNSCSHCTCWTGKAVDALITKTNSLQMQADTQLWPPFCMV